MRTEEPRAIHLADYKAPEFRIRTVHLDFSLEPEATRVSSRLEIERLRGNGPLVLAGENQKLLSVTLDGRALNAGDYLLDDKNLTIANPPARLTLEVSSRCGCRWSSGRRRASRRRRSACASSAPTIGEFSPFSYSLRTTVISESRSFLAMKECVMRSASICSAHFRLSLRGLEHLVVIGAVERGGAVELHAAVLELARDVADASWLPLNIRCSSRWAMPVSP